MKDLLKSYVTFVRVCTKQTPGPLSEIAASANWILLGHIVISIIFRLLLALKAT